MVNNKFYYLNSTAPISLNSGELLEISLSLKKCIIKHNTIVAGKILGGGIPLDNSLIIVMDDSLRALFKGYSDSKGIFLFKETIPPGNYKIIAYANGYIPSKIENLLVEENKPSKVFFSLTADGNSIRGLVYGRVLSTKGKPVINGKVYLSYHGKSVTNADSITNDQGEYIIYNLFPGEYSIFAEASGYETSEPSYIAIKGNERLSMDIKLRAKGDNLGNISGTVILNGEVFGDVPVFLYKLKGKGFSLEDVQTTNSEGLFIFLSLPPGDYKVYSPLPNSKSFNQVFTLT